MSSIDIDEKTRPVDTDSGEHDRFAHYVRKDEIVRSAVEGTPVVALCGKVWIPVGDPSKYPVCGTCKEIMATLRGGA